MNKMKNVTFVLCNAIYKYLYNSNENFKSIFEFLFVDKNTTKADFLLFFFLLYIEICMRLMQET